MFLIDDIWPAPGRPEGYLPELELLLSGSPNSRIAISTRSARIAIKTGSQVEFGARDREGGIAFDIFMSHAAPQIEFCDTHVTAARGIVGHCAGLPIALAVTGEAIVLRVNAGLQFETACEKYFHLLSNKMYSGMYVLDAAISLSLDSLQKCVHEDMKLNTPYTVREMYFSLCVLENQQPFLASVLCRMWQVDEPIALEICILFYSMSLSKVSPSGDTVHIRDLNLDFIRRMAGETSTEWHQRLLNGHIPPGNCGPTSDNSNLVLRTVHDPGVRMSLRIRSTFDETCADICTEEILVLSLELLCSMFAGWIPGCIGEVFPA